LSFPFVTLRQIGAETVQSVDGRDLHAFLGVATPFKDWIARRVEDFGFEDGTDFCTFLSESTGGRPGREYAVAIDMAKELAMVERSAKGKRVRQYFIECERRAKSAEPPPNFAIPQNFADALQLAADQQRQIAMQETAIAAMQPKAAFHDAVAETVNTQDMNTVAKVLGTGRTRLFARLRQRSILMESNLPYQQYVDAGYFRVVELRPWKDAQGNSHAAYKTVVTGKGLTFLQRLLERAEPSSATTAPSAVS
jgi:anti-repressor protein